MKTAHLKIEDILSLHEIRKAIENKEALSEDQQIILSNFLGELPEINETFSKQLEELTPIPSITLEIMSFKEIKIHLEKWMKLFEELPSVLCVTRWNDMHYNSFHVKHNLVVLVSFLPSLTHLNSNQKKGDWVEFNLYLKSDGTAKFIITGAPVNKFNTLKEFKGSWINAYNLLAKISNKGWPQEKFPTEFENLLQS